MRANKAVLTITVVVVALILVVSAWIFLPRPSVGQCIADAISRSRFLDNQERASLLGAVSLRPMFEEGSPAWDYSGIGDAIEFLLGEETLWLPRDGTSRVSIRGGPDFEQIVGQIRVRIEKPLAGGGSEVLLLVPAVPDQSTMKHPGAGNRNGIEIAINKAQVEIPRGASRIEILEIPPEKAKFGLSIFLGKFKFSKLWLGDMNPGSLRLIGESAWPYHDVIRAGLTDAGVRRSRARNIIHEAEQHLLALNGIEQLELALRANRGDLGSIRNPVAAVEMGLLILSREGMQPSRGIARQVIAQGRRIVVAPVAPKSPSQQALYVVWVFRPNAEVACWPAAWSVPKSEDDDKDSGIPTLLRILGVERPKEPGRAIKP